MVLPSKVMLPFFGDRRPEMVRMVVLLPAPLPPMRVTISPWYTLSEMPFTAAMLP